MSVLDRFFEGDIRALSRVISHIENREDGYRDILGVLYEKSGKSLRIGITGPPGAGKSTLVNGLAHEYLKENKKVGVVAVDPTSPFTGGALLGDRVRMNEFPPGGDFYFRSMATRGATGGLAAATGNVTVALDAFGFDITLIETVGVGQVELDIIDACDTVVVTVVPESGDAVQTMKAGLMEIADIFVVNKADRSGAERLAQDLKQTLQTRAAEKQAWQIPIISTVAVEQKNVDLLHEKIGEHIGFITLARPRSRLVEPTKNSSFRVEAAITRMYLLAFSRWQSKNVAAVLGGSRMRCMDCCGERGSLRSAGVQGNARLEA